LFSFCEADVTIPSSWFVGHIQSSAMCTYNGKSRILRSCLGNNLKLPFYSYSSYDDCYTGDDPVYGNLSQDVLGKFHFKNVSIQCL